jgi:prepilin-type N-terminal cleavage/methylation domain-containing protein
MKPKGFVHETRWNYSLKPRRIVGPSGFSLFELILVLVILVAVASIVVPSINGTLKQQQFQRECDRIRVVWEETRLLAMRTGQAQVFRFVAGSGEYSVEPWLQATDEVEASNGATIMMAGGLAKVDMQSGLVGAAGAELGSAAEKLEEGFVFSAGAVLGDTRTMLIQQQTGTVSGGAGNQSAPIMFYPDGTTSTAEVAIKNENGAQRLLRIRGLTGEVSVVRAVGDAG